MATKKIRENSIKYDQATKNPEWSEYSSNLRNKLKQIQNDIEPNASFMSDLGLSHLIEQHVADNFECGVMCAKNTEDQLLTEYKDHLIKNKTKREDRNTPEAKKERKIQKTKSSLDMWESVLQNDPNNQNASVWVNKLKRQLNKLEN